MIQPLSLEQIRGLLYEVANPNTSQERFNEISRIFKTAVYGDALKNKESIADNDETFKKMVQLNSWIEIVMNDIWKTSVTPIPTPLRYRLAKISIVLGFIGIILSTIGGYPLHYSIASLFTIIVGITIRFIVKIQLHTIRTKKVETRVNYFAPQIESRLRQLRITLQ